MTRGKFIGQLLAIIGVSIMLAIVVGAAAAWVSNGNRVVIVIVIVATIAAWLHIIRFEPDELPWRRHD